MLEGQETFKLELTVIKEVRAANGQGDINI